MRKPRLTSNLAYNFLNFGLSTLVGVFFTPYLIKNLGFSAYGIIPLAQNLSAYTAVVALVVNASVARFITIALEQEKYEDANKYFNTSLFCGFLIISLLLIPSAWLICNSEAVLKLPKGLESETAYFLIFTLAVILISIAATPFEVATFCSNRFDIRTGISTLNILLRVSIVVLLFNLLSPRILHVGVGLAFGAVSSLVAAVYAWHKLTPRLSINIRCFCVKSLKELVKAGGWISINQVGTLLLLSIDLLLVNRLFGAESGGQYASLLQWSILLRSLALSLAGVLSPSMIFLYAKGDIAGLISYSRLAVKFLGIFLALPIAVVAGLSGPILHVWLGGDFVSLAPLLTLMVAPLCINLGYIPLHTISTATNNVRAPGIVQIVSGLANLALAFTFAHTLDFGLYGIAAAGLLVLTIRNVVFTPLYAAHVLGSRYTTFLKELIPISVGTSGLTLVFWFISSRFNLFSWLQLSAAVFVVGGTYLAMVWLMVLNKSEKLYILSSLPFKRVASA